MLKLGMVTYQWGATWDLPTIIKNCAAAGFDGVELRSTHKHGVEPTLSKAERAEVRKKFSDSPVKCVGPGSACEYHAADHGIVQQNIELTKKFLELSADIGGSGVKVRPNGFVQGIDRSKTIAQIGEALRQCGPVAADWNQQIRVEVHGHGTSDPDVVRQIMEAANHPQVVVCWNSNPGETVNGSLKPSFDKLNKHLGATIHIHDLFDSSYPYRELFQLLNEQNYDGYCLSESPATADPVTVMKYYKALFMELSKPAMAG